MRGMRSALAVAVVLAAVPVAAKRPVQPGFAEPGDIIAAEGYFAHVSAAKGVRAAIRATAAPDAQIYAPQLMRVTAFAAHAVTAPWHTRQLWMSCDGSIAVTHGQWQQGEAIGWYIAIWKRQKRGDYKWVLEQGGGLTAPLPESDMIAAGVADCPVRRARADPAPAADSKAPPAEYSTGHADDGTLTWATEIAPAGRSFTVAIKQDGAMHEVLRATAAPGS